MTDNQRHGAALPPPVLAYAVLTVLAAVLPALVAGVRPWASDAALLDFVRHHHAGVRLQAVLTLAAAVPLAVLSAVLSDRIKRLGLDVPGRLIVLVGGAVATALLACSAVLTLALLSGPRDLVVAGNRVAVLLGGAAFAPFAGLLVAGAAVTGLLGRLLPRWWAWFGLAVAAVGEVCVLALVTDGVDPLLPVARFGSIVFLLGCAVLLREHPRPD